MRKKLKAVIFQGVSVVLLIGLLAGCSGKANNEGKNGASPSASPSSTPEQSASASEKPMKLKFWAHFPEQNKLDSPGINAIKKKFNVDIEFIPTSHDTYKEDVNLQIASRNIPDWIKEPASTDYLTFIDQKIVAEIPQDLIEKYMPKYVEWIKRYIDKDDPFKYVRVNGKIYGLPTIWDIGLDGQQLGFRGDWMKKVGVDKVPETIEEEEALLTKFRNEDPDNNGKKDTYGLTAFSEDIEMLFSSVFGAYDAYPGTFREKGGKVVRGEIEPGAKEALSTLNRWYKNELIDPEFVVNKSSNFEDKVITGKAGAGDWYWWSFYPAASFLGGEGWYDKIRKDIPDFEFKTTGGIKGPDGKRGIRQSSPASATGVMFGVQLEKDQEKMIKYMQIFEATSFDPETYELLSFGVKGTHWDYGAKGTVEFKPPFDKEEERKKLGIAGYYSMPGSFNDYDFTTKYTAEASLQPIAKEARAKGVRVFDILKAYQKPVYNEYNDKLNQLTMSTFIDFITGKKPLDQFDKFVEEWKQMGGDKMMEEAQQVYDKNK